MPKIVTPLVDDEQIQNFALKEKPYNVNDGKGLSILTKPDGQKNWMFRYTQPHNTKINNIKIANFPSTSLLKAREIAAHYRDLLLQGIDPAIYRQQQQHEALLQSRTIQSEFENWIAIDFDKPAASYIKTTRGQFNIHILPALGHVPLVNITRKMAIDALSPLKAADKIETLRKCCEMLSRFMDWSVENDYVEVNRLSGLSRAFRMKKSEHLPTIAPNRMSELLSTVHHSSVQEQTKNVILFQLSTMIRPYESVSAQWKDIDFTNKLWRIPADKMKMNRPHTVYLNAVALDILKQQKQVSGNSKFVFPNRVDPKRHMSSGTANAAISRMGFKDQLVAHGLRSLASTTMNEVGFNAHHIEASLSHVDENGVRKTYNNAVYITFRRDLSDWWGHWLIKCSNRLITPALPLLKYVFEEHPFTTSKLEGQNNDNQFMFSSSRLSAQQQVAMG